TRKWCEPDGELPRGTCADRPQHRGHRQRVVGRPPGVAGACASSARSSPDPAGSYRREGLGDPDERLPPTEAVALDPLIGRDDDEGLDRVVRGTGVDM